MSHILIFISCSEVPLPSESTKGCYWYLQEKIKIVHMNCIMVSVSSQCSFIFHMKNDLVVGWIHLSIQSWDEG